MKFKQIQKPFIYKTTRELEEHLEIEELIREFEALVLTKNTAMSYIKPKPRKKPDNS